MSERLATITVVISRRADGGLWIGASSKYPVQEGETWERGNDLADGDVSRETVQSIADDIWAVAHGFRNSFEMRQPEKRAAH